MIEAGFFCELTGRYIRIADADEQALRRIEERLFGFFPCRRDAETRARSNFNAMNLRANISRFGP